MRGLCLVAAIALAPSWARANPLDMYGFGARATALGGAVGADISDPYAVYYNPAGLVRLRGLRVDLGYQYNAPTLRTDGRDNGVAASQGVVGGIAAPGRAFGVPFAFGIGFHFPDARLSQVLTPPQPQPRWELYGMRTQRMVVVAALAISPLRWLHLGGAVAFLASTDGGVSIDGRISATNPDTTALRHTVDADLTAIRYVHLGAQAELGRGVSLGVSYRDEFRISLALRASLRGQITLGPADNPRSFAISGAYTLNSRTLAGFQPRQVTASASWQINERWRLGAALTWSQWSRFEDPTAALDVALDLVVPAGFGITTPAVPMATPRVQPGFQDTFTPRVGLQYQAPVGRHRLELRAGYHWDPSPAPDQGGVTTFIDVNRHVVALGCGLALRQLGAVIPGGITLDAFASAQILEARTVMKDDPTDRTGDFVADGYVISAGLNAAVSFR
jgi:long-chain fatty acid transport protein